MHCFCTGLLDCRENVVNYQIRLVRRRRPNMNRFISHFDVQCISVGIGIDSDCGNTHLARRLDHTAGNFSTIGNENFFKHLRVHNHFFAVDCRLPGDSETIALRDTLATYHSNMEGLANQISVACACVLQALPALRTRCENQGVDPVVTVSEIFQSIRDDVKVYVTESCAREICL